MRTKLSWHTAHIRSPTSDDICSCYPPRQSYNKLCITMRPFTSSTWLWLSYPASSYADPLKCHFSMTSTDLRAIHSGDVVYWSAGIVVAFPNSTEFTNATELRVAWEAPSYAASVSPDNEEDVATAVKLVFQCNIPRLVTSG